MTDLDKYPWEPRSRNYEQESLGYPALCALIHSNDTITKK